MSESLPIDRFEFSQYTLSEDSTPQIFVEVTSEI